MCLNAATEKSSVLQVTKSQNQSNTAIATVAAKSLS